MISLFANKKTKRGTIKLQAFKEIRVESLYFGSLVHFLIVSEDSSELV